MTAKMRHFSTDPGPEGEHTKLIMINNDYDYFSARNLMEVQYFSRFFLHPGHIHRGAGEQHGGLHLRMYNPWQGRKVMVMVMVMAFTYACTSPGREGM